MRQHGRALSEWQVSKLFTAPYNKAATVQNAVSGYDKCGINPALAFLQKKISSRLYLLIEMNRKTIQV